MGVPTEAKTSVSVTRRISASKERVYRAFTNHDDLNNWFCNHNLLRLRPNGAFLFVWQAEDFSAAGVFTTIEANAKLVLTWRATWKGNVDEAESRMTISFEGDESETSVTLLHDNLSAGFVEGYNHQWNQRMDDLKRYLETGAVPAVTNRVIIGINPGPISQQRADELGIDPQHGTQVVGVVPNFGAEKAGIQLDDIIVGVNDMDLVPPQNLGSVMVGKRPGESVDIVLYRGAEKLTLSMELSPYPVPHIPETNAALADHIASQQAQFFAALDEALTDVSDAEADAYPAEDEWNVKQVLAHLLASERFQHEQIAGLYTVRQPHYWSGNHDGRLLATASVYGDLAGLVAELRRAFAETVMLIRDYPQSNPEALWQNAFNSAQWIAHAHSHLPQIREAIAAARQA